jgi:hypothetical protein
MSAVAVAARTVAIGATGSGAPCHQCVVTATSPSSKPRLMQQHQSGPRRQPSGTATCRTKQSCASGRVVCQSGPSRTAIARTGARCGHALPRSDGTAASGPRGRARRVMNSSSSEPRRCHTGVTPTASIRDDSALTRQRRAIPETPRRRSGRYRGSVSRPRSSARRATFGRP